MALNTITLNDIQEKEKHWENQIKEIANVQFHPALSYYKYEQQLIRKNLTCAFSFVLYEHNA